MEYAAEYFAILIGLHSQTMRSRLSVDIMLDPD